MMNTEQRAIMKRILDQNVREDIALRKDIIKLGFSVEYGSSFSVSLAFTKGIKKIWYCVMHSHPNKLVWRCADLVNGNYRNHRTYETLKTAVETEA